MSIPLLTRGIVVPRRILDTRESTITITECAVGAEIEIPITLPSIEEQLVSIITSSIEVPVIESPIVPLSFDTEEEIKIATTSDEPEEDFGIEVTVKKD